MFSLKTISGKQLPVFHRALIEYFSALLAWFGIHIIKSASFPIRRERRVIAGHLRNN